MSCIVVICFFRMFLKALKEANAVPHMTDACHFIRSPHLVHNGILDWASEVWLFQGSSHLCKFFFVCLLFSSQSSGILQVLETHFTCFRDGGRNTKKWRLSSKSKSSVHLNTISCKAYTHTITCRSIHLAIPSQITSIGYVNWLKIVSNNNFSEKINTSCLREYNLTWGNNN